MPDLGQMMLETGLRYAQRPALWVDGTTYQYAELLDRALTIAEALIAHHTTQRCALFSTRTVTAYSGLVGALLAGAVYVPLNLRNPPSRLLSALQTAQIDAMLLDHRSMALGRSLLEQLPPLTVLLDDAIPDWTVSMPQHRFVAIGSASAPRSAKASPQQAAYLLFTSGSTGQPKGVLVSHENVSRYLQFVTERYALTPEDRCSQLFDLTFDLSVHDCFATWQAGATLYCLPDAARMAPHMFIKRHELTSWFSVPSTLAVMSQLRLLKANEFPSLRWSLFCGEALPRALVQQWAAAAPNSVIDNLYGPTETTIAITSYRVPRDKLMTLPEIIPIGQVFPHHRDVIINDEGQPSNIGELYLSGPQVSMGYWQQPKLTAQVFRPPPGIEMGRWYRTGDRVRRSEHGLQFLGRVDRQVKISGYRVELQEVEAALRAAAGNVSAAAIAWPVDANGLAHGLIGFVSANGRQSEAIIAACRQKLPSYMVPTTIHRVAKWPLNQSGKTDYARLRFMIDRHDE